MKKREPMDQLAVGAAGQVVSLTATGRQRKRLLELGFVPGTAVRALLAAPSGDPVAYGVRGTVIALRCADARYIQVERQEGGA